jgi:cyclopropane fatty-acyl-phospholipid synthase-like methyltransferase
LDQELQKYYEERFTTMSTQGWRDFIEDVETFYESYNKVSTIETFEEFHKRKGQLDILQWILSLKDVSEQTYEELQQEE